MLQRLNPVSPMDDRDRGCRESVTSGRAGLTLHRWFDASQCVPREALTAIRQKDVTNVGLHALNLVNLKVLFEDGAIGTSTWVIYPKITLMLSLYKYVCIYAHCVVSLYFCVYYPPAWANWLLIPITRFTRAQSRD